MASPGGQILNQSQPHSMPVRVLLLLQEENQSGDEKVTVATNTCSYSKQGAQLMVVMLLVMMGLVAVVVMGQQILAFMQEKSSLAALGASGFSFGAGGGVGISMIATSR